MYKLNLKIYQHLDHEYQFYLKLTHLNSYFISSIKPINSILKTHFCWVVPCSHPLANMFEFCIIFNMPVINACHPYWVKELFNIAATNVAKVTGVYGILNVVVPTSSIGLFKIFAKIAKALIFDVFPGL